ncbi:methyltransferase domain-containing protein [Candidatus Amarobacter glycogenicus]|uniref:methyltransferase domain-containing protein n=1 Tax=Candidatus Amarobacter glycogenicus TaxID=3140699 RepID=UPI002A0ED9B0|nr:methyltransferase domain-containing protein [Dehalococcoidia bacterium]
MRRGFDSPLLRGRSGPGGRVFAVDMTAEMRAKTEAGAEALGLTNVTVLEGFAEDLPVAPGVADVVISNGVINLCPDKQAIFREMYRVLRPGADPRATSRSTGRFPRRRKTTSELWSAGIAGALLEAEWRQVLALTGFVDVVMSNEIDVFSGSKHESDAAEFDTRGVTVFALEG